ncbi:MAG TPA: HisA/HisF-related TIM barrel protein [Pirellulales bacterium]|nr:HisA/HisF-related TIM barrel protein [Pirellulales bacterium]
MRIIPVLDLMDGVVVRGVAGRRSEYRPIESTLCLSAEPTVVACAIVDRYRTTEFYIADLDAIAGSEPAWGIYEEIAATGARLLVDAGVGDVGRAQSLADFRAAGEPLAGVIVGLESLAPECVDGVLRADDQHLAATIAPLLRAIGAERLVFSLDLKGGTPLTNVRAWRATEPLKLAASVIDAGVRRLIILDLADVGVGEGVGTLALCQAIRAEYPQIEIIAGGGVRGPGDLRQMAACGCDAALVASALHDGRLSKEALARIDER